MNNLEKFGNLVPGRINFIDILTSGRASAIFLQGLLDGHPQIIGLLGLFSVKEKDLANPNLDLIVEKLYEDIQSDVNFFSKHYSLQKEFPKEALLKYLKEYVGVFGLNRKNVYIGVHYAYAKHTKKDLKKLKYILVPAHIPIESLGRIKLFPRQKIIFTVRDPRSALLSYKNVKNILGGIFLIHKSFTFFKRLKRKIPNNLIVVRHEDLILKYDQIRKKIVKFLEIEDSKSLDSATFFGNPFYGSEGPSSSTLKLKADKPNKEFAKELWKHELSTSEIKRIQFFFSKFMRTFGYKKMRQFEPISIGFFGTNYLILSKEVMESKKGFSKGILVFVRGIYFLPLIGRFLCKLILFSFFFYKFLVEMVKLKYTKI